MLNYRNAIHAISIKIFTSASQFQVFHMISLFVYIQFYFIVLLLIEDSQFCFVRMYVHSQFPLEILESPVDYIFLELSSKASLNIFLRNTLKSIGDSTRLYRPHLNVFMLPLVREFHTSCTKTVTKFEQGITTSHFTFPEVNNL